MATNTRERNSTRPKVIEFLAKEFDIPPNEIEKAFFKSADTMALTQVGHRIMSKVFNFKQFPIKSTLLTKHYLGLRHLEYPYFLTEKWLILYNAQDSVMLELYGSADEFLDAFANDV